MQSSASWDKPLSLAESTLVLRDLALRHARESGPYSLDLQSILQREDWKALVEYELDYGIAAAPHHVLQARQALGFFQKLEPLALGIDKEAVAFAKFEESEALCKATNSVFRSLRLGTAMVPGRVHLLLQRARRKIKGILGNCPGVSNLKYRFGPGATTSIRKKDANPVTKMAAGFQCSTDLLASGLLPGVLRELPHYSAAHASAYTIDEEDWLVEHVPVDLVIGTLQFVPKSAKTYRTIVVEPSLNTMCQAGIGAVIAQRLLAAGIDIRDQTRNQRAALEGSLQGELATIDLSSASDCISTELVRWLLPPDWFKLLSAFRTSSVGYKDRVFTLEKFSSMGNGFTFPLETLLFYALTQAVCASPQVLAYGDDIICPSHHFTTVCDLLSFCGFVPNRSKSFYTGPFRESCGCDYYKGINVRPFYQKHLVSGRTLFILHNFYKRSYDDEGAAAVLALIPRSLRIYGPDGYGDGHLISSKWPRQRSSAVAKKGWGGSYFETYRSVPRKWRNPYPGDWVSPLYSIYIRSEELLSESLPGLREPSTPVDTSGLRPSWSLPGEDGYCKTLIYTLTP